MKKLLSLVRAAVDRYDMIDDGDKIAVGVSGGKDSLALLYALARLRSFYPKHFEVIAITLDYRFGGMDGDYSEIQKLCDSLDVKYIVKKTDLWDVIFNIRKEKNPCSLCAKMRRGILHDTAKEYGCNKIALGHNYDDAVETFVMNLFNEGRIGCFSPNIFSISPDVVVSDKAFTRMNNHLRNEWGITVEEIPYREISKMGGLLRCSTLPLVRE